MNCAGCREALSARLDGEDDPAERAAVDAHLESCTQCRVYLDGAAQVTRLARTGIATPVPDLVDAVRAAAPRPRGAWLAPTLRALLAVVGLAQLALGVAGMLAAGTSDAHHDADLAGASLEHFAHESSAWNLALAVGFLYVAGRTSRSTGLVPVLGAFVGVLAVLSVVDVVLGRVQAVRLVSHGLVVLGFLLIVTLGRLDRRGEPDPEALHGRSQPAEGRGAAAPLDRQQHADGWDDLKPTARQDAA